MFVVVVSLAVFGWCRFVQRYCAAYSALLFYLGRCVVFPICCSVFSFCLFLIGLGAFAALMCLCFCSVFIPFCELVCRSL